MSLLSLVAVLALLALVPLPYAIYVVRSVRNEGLRLERTLVEWMIASARNQGYTSSQAMLLGALGIAGDNSDYQLEVERRNELIRREAMLPPELEYIVVPEQPTDQSDHTPPSISLQGRGMTLNVDVPPGGLSAPLAELLRQATEEMSQPLPQSLVEDSAKEPEVSNGTEQSLVVVSPEGAQSSTPVQPLAA